MYFHTDNNDDITTLMHAASVAMVQEKRFRVNIDAKGRLIYKVGEGMWSAPMESTEDPYRDIEMSHEIVVDAENVKIGDRLTAFGNVKVNNVLVYSEFMTKIVFATPATDGLPCNSTVVLSNIATVTVRRPL